MESSFIILNGERHLIRQGQSIADLLSSVGMNTLPVVVELNEKAVLPAEFAATELHPGDRVEIVSIVAGG